MSGPDRPSVTSAPHQMAGRFSRLLGFLKTALLLYVLLYVLQVFGTYGWLSTAAPRVALPQGAGFAFSMAPVGVQLSIPVLQLDIGEGTAKPEQALELQNSKIIWPLLQPGHLQLRADRASTTVVHVGSSDRFAAHQFKATASLPFNIKLQAASLDWQVTLHDMKNESVATIDDGRTVTFVSPVVTYHEGFMGLFGKPQQLAFQAGPVILPGASTGAMLQADTVRFALDANKKLPRQLDEPGMRAWHESSGMLSVTDFLLSAIGIDVLLAGDVQLDDMLALKGNLQIQVSGIGDGYVKLGQLGVIPPQHYRLLGYLLQALPQAGQQTYNLPVKIDKNKVFVGPAAAFKLGLMPWQPASAAPTATEQLLDTPVATPASPAVPLE